MRYSRLLLLLLSVCCVFAAKPAKERKTVVTGGVQKPGVQIPFAQLKPETEIAMSGTPLQLHLAGSLYVANAGEKGLAVIDVKTNKAGTPVTGIAKPCSGMTQGFDSLWVADCGSGMLVRLDAKKHTVQAKIETGAGTGVEHGLAATADSIWMLTDDRTSLARIDPVTNRIVVETRLPAGCRSLVYVDPLLWVACPKNHQLVAVDAQTNLISERLEVSGSPVALASGEGALWVLSEAGGKVTRIDPKTKKIVSTIELKIESGAQDIAVGAGSVYVTAKDFALTRIDVEAMAVVQQFHGASGKRLHVAADAIWLLQENKLLRIDPKRVPATLAE